MDREKILRKTGENKAKIVVVDDHPIVRQGLADLINQEKDLEVCGQAEDAAQAMDAIRAIKPDMAIVDISLKETSGIQLIKDIKARHDSVAILALSMHEESLYAERTLRAGAMGYVMKREATDKVVVAIRKILNGQIYLSERMSTRMLRKVVDGRADVAAFSVNCLSDRELEVFTLLGQGNGTRQISEQLYLSVKTIETYRSHIKEKLNIANAAELLQHAFQWVNNKG